MRKGTHKPQDIVVGDPETPGIWYAGGRVPGIFGHMSDAKPDFASEAR